MHAALPSLASGCLHRGQPSPASEPVHTQDDGHFQPHKPSLITQPLVRARACVFVQGVWSRALGLPIERPKSLTVGAILEKVGAAAK